MARSAPPVELHLDVRDATSPLRHRVADAVVEALRTSTRSGHGRR